LLDRLNEHLSISGNTFANFILEEGAVVPLTRSETKDTRIELARTSNTSIASVGTNELVDILNAFTRQNYDILTPQKKLMEAANHQFLLTTEQVGIILNLSRSTISSWESGTTKLGFTFTKVKEGVSVLWKVARSEG
jgi:hypothetical protein